MVAVVDVFDAKVRAVGTSLGVLIPKDVTSRKRIKKDEIVKVAILRKDLSLLEKSFGSVKTRPFVREHNDRAI